MPDAENESLRPLLQALARHSDPEQVKAWMKANARRWRELMSYYHCAMMEIETKFNVLSEDLSFREDRNPIESIRTRLKTPESILDKLGRKCLFLSIDSIENHIYDIAGVRVICTFESDIYRLADAFLRQDDITLIREKDYIQHPKENGYRSLHLIVAVPIFLHDEKKSINVEVQFRTLAMDLWASTEHKIRYKQALSVDEADTRALKDCADLCSSLDRQLEAIYHHRLRTKASVPDGGSFHVVQKIK